MEQLKHRQTIHNFQESKTDETYFPIFSKLISSFSESLMRYPVFLGQLTFYISLIVVINVGFIRVILAVLSVSKIGNKWMGEFFTFSDIRYIDSHTIIFFSMAFLMSVALNDIVFIIFDIRRFTPKRILLVSFLIGLLSLWSTVTLTEKVTQNLFLCC